MFDIKIGTLTVRNNYYISDQFTLEVIYTHSLISPVMIKMKTLRSWRVIQIPLYNDGVYFGATIFQYRLVANFK
jgi:hypothetical protein